MRTLSILCLVVFGAIFAKGSFLSVLSLDQSPVNIMPSMDIWIQRGLEIVAIVLGLLMVFAGYRLLRLVLFLGGFVVFYYICFHVLQAQVKNWAEFWILLISAGSGLLGGFFLLGLGLAAFKLAAFIFGFIGGAQMAYLALAATPLASIVTNVSPGTKWQVWIIVGIILGSGLVIGILTVLISRVLLVIITACIGAFTVGVSVDALAFNNNSVISRMMESLIAHGSLPANVTVGWESYLILSGVVVLAVAGIIIQLRGTAKNYHHHHGHTDPEYRPLLIQDNY